MSDKKRILFIWNYFYLESEKGESRFAYLARLLVENGCELEVVTSSFYHMNKVHRDIKNLNIEQYPYKITFINEPGYKKNVSFKRLKSIKVFNNGVKDYLYGISKVPDLVYVPVPSIKLGHICANYAKAHNIPFVMDIEDLWPESFKMLTHSALLTRLLFFPWFISANKLYRKADAIVSISQTFLDRVLSVRKDNPPHCVSYIGANFKRAASVDASRLKKAEEDTWITYIGTLGKSYNIRLFIDALDILAREAHRMDFILCVLGDGPDREKLINYSKSKQGRVKFLGLLPYEEMIMILKKSDYGINPINPHSVASIINKVGDYASVGLPVINTQQCTEYINILRETNSGISLLTGNPYEIVEFLLNQKDHNEYEFNRDPIQLFNRKDNYERIINVIKGQLANE